MYFQTLIAKSWNIEYFSSLTYYIFFLIFNVKFSICLLKEIWVYGIKSLYSDFMVFVTKTVKN